MKTPELYLMLKYCCRAKGSIVKDIVLSTIKVNGEKGGNELLVSGLKFLQMT